MCDKTRAFMEKHPHLHFTEAGAVARSLYLLDVLNSEAASRFPACPQATMLPALAGMVGQIMGAHAPASAANDEFNPTTRELLKASDNFAVPLFVLGRDVAARVLYEAQRAANSGIDAAVARRVALVSFFDTLKRKGVGHAELLALVAGADFPVFGVDGVPELDGDDADLLDCLGIEEAA